MGKEWGLRCKEMGKEWRLRYKEMGRGREERKKEKGCKIDGAIRPAPSVVLSA